MFENNGMFTPHKLQIENEDTSSEDKSVFEDGETYTPYNIQVRKEVESLNEYKSRRQKKVDDLNWKPQDEYAVSTPRAVIIVVILIVYAVLALARKDEWFVTLKSSLIVVATSIAVLIVSFSVLFIGKKKD